MTSNKLPKSAKTQYAHLLNSVNKNTYFMDMVGRLNKLALSLAQTSEISEFSSGSRGRLPAKALRVKGIGKTSQK